MEDSFSDQNSKTKFNPKMFQYYWTQTVFSMVTVLFFLQIFLKAAFAFMGNGGGNGQKQTEPGSLLMIIEPSRLCGERAPSPQIRVNYS